MIDLKIVPNQDKLIAGLGITLERRRELEAGMDDILSGYADEEKSVCVGETLEDFSKLCNTIEEMVFCAISHTVYMMYNFKSPIAPVRIAEVDVEPSKK